MADRPVESQGWRRDIWKDSTVLEAMGRKDFTLTRESGQMEPEVKELAIPGAMIISNVLTPNTAAIWAESAEALGFDNAHHPGYQNLYIDQKEEAYRKNDRCVYKASEAEVGALFEVLRPHLQERLEMGDLGNWKLETLNDMWRFYKYRPAETEDQARKAKSQHFPPHFDNATVKATSLMSFCSVLVYLSGDGGERLFGGGETLFLESRCKVEAVAGQVCVFRHVGEHSPLHAGMPLWRLGEQAACKYVLRTDVMYTLVDGQLVTPRVSPPYNNEQVLDEDVVDTFVEEDSDTNES